MASMMTKASKMIKSRIASAKRQSMVSTLAFYFYKFEDLIVPLVYVVLFVALEETFELLPMLARDYTEYDKNVANLVEFLLEEFHNPIWIDSIIVLCRS